jgi:hypothetical protein
MDPWQNENSALIRHAQLCQSVNCRNAAAVIADCPQCDMNSTIV